MFELFLISATSLSLAISLIILILPWTPWRMSEQLDAITEMPDDEQIDTTVLIPARNEVGVLKETLEPLRGLKNIKVILIDDHSTDGSAELARSLGLNHFELIDSQTLPEGWSGKLWALEQGLQRVDTEFVQLLDADIKISPGLVNSLREKSKSEKLDFISLLAYPNIGGFFEKWLMPAYVFFFKLLYPFKLSNRRGHFMAAAAGGCVFMRSEVLKKLGSLECIKDAVIDDCALAKQVKGQGFSTWIGCTRSAVSVRPYAGLAGIWEMVSRTAYTQLFFSPSLLLICTLLMFSMYLAPAGLLLYMGGDWMSLGIAAYLTMTITYIPTLIYYACSPLWALTMPGIAALYLAMTWWSAIRYYRGVRTHWKGRNYGEDMRVKESNVLNA